MLENIIMDQSKLPIVQLYPKAQKAKENPLTGIAKTTNKYVEFVIRDMAKITIGYLPIMTYGSFTDPVNQLKGKFSKKDIVDFVGRSEKTIETRQLLKLILNSAQKYQIDQQLTTNDLITDHETKDPISQPDDIYGDYGNSPQPQDVEQVEITDLTTLTTKGIANFLIKMFDAK